ncbi:hypothetical protein LAZ40_09895 [Cereibacter sphaeroides]|uniref:hypothetical protein n=1 Tax=Cereibacter sphaeroides TaxID=1063 RepID=UPI001F199B3E|nr:hypothetical protein [Cereibacter sphaeroides]MCE6959363.1 hypothetical protein [Cereibacter sphaeroides]MCE6972955.1 hypothetical protein [Cereibacter sphaeroides]
MRAMNLVIQPIEEAFRPEYTPPHGAAPTDLPREARAYFEAAARSLAALPELQGMRTVSPDIPEGPLRQIRVLLASPEMFDCVFPDSAGALGLHVINVPEDDPFGDGGELATELRVMICWPPSPDLVPCPGNMGEFDRNCDAFAWLVTLTHEVAHAVMFAENGNFNVPATLAEMEIEIGRDLFDISTGYGIRALVVDGVEVEPENMEHAADLMEEAVEETGRRWAEVIVTGDLSTLAFLNMLDGQRGDFPLPAPTP